METDQGILDEIEASIDKGARLDAVDSTDDELVLVMADDRKRSRYRLDRAATRSLLQAELIERLTRANASRPGVLVQS